LDYYNFTYHAVSNAPGANEVEVAISDLGNGFSFTRVDGAPFTAQLGEIVQFEIDYSIVIDPAPVISRSGMRIDPPTGSVTVAEYVCSDVSYVYTGLCLGGSPETLKVGTPPTGFPDSVSVNLAHPAGTSQGIGLLFTLDGTNGVSTFDGLDTSSTFITLGDVPEPASASILAVGLLALGAGYKLRKQRQRPL
jgi:hypothetical protein